MLDSPVIRTDPKKRLAVFLDGTWNSVSDNTNVWRIKCLCSPIGEDGLEQRSYYDVGVNGFFGGIFGKGTNDNVLQAYEWLIDNYDLNDEIYIFGFSRGAYTARSLSGFIALCGLLKAGAALSVKQLFERYKEGLRKATIYNLIATNERGGAAGLSTEERWMLKYCIAAPITVVAVWDTVGFLGLPFGNLKGISRSTFQYLHTGLRQPIKNGYHALAIDEHRRAFQPTLWTAKNPNPRSLDSVEQRWFVGAHANVGGGCPSDLLAQPPLRWIMNKVSRHGLSFRTNVDLDGDVLKATVSNSHAEFMNGHYKKFSKRCDRPIGAKPGMSDGTPDYVVNETIDSSVFDRCRTDSEYRPKSLVDWAAHHSLALEVPRGSVRADDPAIAVPEDASPQPLDRVPPATFTAPAPAAPPAASA